jgi:hypothetical protein
MLRVVREMRTIFGRELEEIGLTVQQAEILIRGSRSGELMPTELTHCL